MIARTSSLVCCGVNGWFDTGVDLAVDLEGGRKIRPSGKGPSLSC
jgi:hypothetical protein